MGRQRDGGTAYPRSRPSGLSEIVHISCERVLAERRACHYTSPRFGTNPCSSRQSGLRLSVRTPAFHAGKTGSIPVDRATIFIRKNVPLFWTAPNLPRGRFRASCVC
ncbi:hypothetical protein BOSEA1005_21766 [Hyphomicrobiales bacterium]|nr:hypothetical protein BOSEA1005_21766 [Hyphomicrobiales bacterium]